MSLYLEAELVIKSYIPYGLHKGMFFINRISVGVIEEYIEVWELTEVPDNEDEFLAKNGTPVDLLIIDEKDNILAIQNQFNTLDTGEELINLELNHINTIFREYDGIIEIAINEEYYEKYKIIIPDIFDDGVILRYYNENDEEE